ncbi:plasmid replication/partition related protein [Acidovorax sp. SUPP3334]|uniref:plasmid replication/partition related protein n=1 Tax=Acidovorax sp. SUPP3334 TaxID=2920881 RepID=UPI0023DE4EEC|nr:plasmid replication/partition related protein [Acidovorax sp. SUPP3334]GKT26406.1 plasmid replication/partition related protein [Acidovorax sp. SUPP3334]
MHIVVNEELKAYIDPLSPDEHAALERSLLAEGCRDALVLWGDVLVDGHNRYGICQKHGLPFQTVQNQNFRSMEDVHLWMIDQHLGRRSVSDFQRGVLALRKREILADRNARASSPESMKATHGDGIQNEAPAHEESSADASTPGPDIEPQPLSNREAIAKAARLSSSQVVMIEKIRKQAAPEVVAAVKSGTLSINAAAAVATLPQEEQRAAAIAGGDELKQAAKRVREAKRRPREDTDAAPAETLQSLRDRVAELTAENEELRRQLAQWQAKAGE